MSFVELPIRLWFWILTHKDQLAINETKYAPRDQHKFLDDIVWGLMINLARFHRDQTRHWVTMSQKQPDSANICTTGKTNQTRKESHRI